MTRRSFLARWCPREPVNGLTHLAGALLSLAGAVLLVRSGLEHGPLHAWALGIFGGTLVLLYLASTLYHSVRCSDRWILQLRRFDHMAIYALIAGTYTPVGLLVIGGRLGAAIVAGAWIVAAAGIVQKALWMNASDWFSAACYLAMGWAGALLIGPLLAGAPPWFAALIALGGLVYTLGAIVFATERPRLWPGRFGAHELWHLCVLGGSAAHFVAILRYVQAA
jgi:hemolysin III